MLWVVAAVVSTTIVAATRVPNPIVTRWKVYSRPLPRRTQVVIITTITTNVNPKVQPPAIWFASKTTGFDAVHTNRQTHIFGKYLFFV